MLDPRSRRRIRYISKQTYSSKNVLIFWLLGLRDVLTILSSDKLLLLLVILSARLSSMSPSTLSTLPWRVLLVVSLRKCSRYDICDVGRSKTTLKKAKIREITYRWYEEYECKWLCKIFVNVREIYICNTVVLVLKFQQHVTSYLKKQDKFLSTITPTRIYACMLFSIIQQQKEVANCVGLVSQKDDV